MYFILWRPMHFSLVYQNNVFYTKLKHGFSTIFSFPMYFLLSCSKCMVPIWHHFANSFYLIFIIFRWNYTFWWKDHVKKATIKAKSKAWMLYNLQPFKKISDFSKSMVLISFKVDFEHLFGLSKQLFIDRKLILMGTDVNR